MFQTVGWSNTIWMKRTKVIGIIVAAVIVLMFISVVCNAYLQAHGLIGYIFSKFSCNFDSDCSSLQKL
jgi:hypothetical protein